MDNPDLLARLEALVTAMQDHAPALDATGEFPVADIAALRAAGLLMAPLPRRWGGLGLGTAPDEAAATLAAFRILGRGNLAVGRLMEAHVNALRLAVRYGSEPLCRAVADDAAAGHLCALWVTDPPGAGLHVGADGMVTGAKQYCSGAGQVTRAVVTVEDAGSTRLAYVRLDHGVTVRPLPGGLAGMRAATTGEVTFESTRATLFGEPGDYLREPDFSCGAWRTSAVTLGGLDALLDELRGQLVARGRQGDPHQQARFGHAMMAAETARLWMAEAAQRAEHADANSASAIGYTGLARLAVERACLEVMETAQRSLGVAAMLRGNPVERLCRDLATYLRQPAGDMVLTEAAVFGLGAA